MSWLIITEFTATFPGNGTALVDIARPICEQRMEIQSTSNRCRPFTARTSLISLCSDVPCLVEIDQPCVAVDLAAESPQYIPVLAGSSLAAIVDNFALACESV